MSYVELQVTSNYSFLRGGPHIKELFAQAKLFDYKAIAITGRNSLAGHELSLIDSFKYAPYFLTVESIVRFAVSKGILCQGRGSAANSAVCYVLSITAIDPVARKLQREGEVMKPSMAGVQIRGR